VTSPLGKDSEIVAPERLTAGVACIGHPTAESGIGEALLSKSNILSIPSTQPAQRRPSSDYGASILLRKASCCRREDLGAFVWRHDGEIAELIGHAFVEIKPHQ
jgi:hypothetical protein